MPALQEYDIVEILTDPEFRKLPEPEQLKVMAEVDPEYAALAPEEQKKVLQDPEFQPPPPLTREEVPGELDRLAAGRFAPTPPLPEFVTRPIEAPPPEPQPFVGPQPGPEPEPPEGPPLQVPEIPPSAAPDLGTLALQAAGAGMGPVGAMGAVLRPDLTRIPEMAKAGAENVASLLAETAKMGIVPGGPLPPAMPADTAVGKEGIQEQAAKAAETYQAPVLPISELTPEPGLSRGIAKGIEQLSSPLNMAIVASLGGVGQVARAAQPIARGVYNLLDTALAGYFGGVMAEGATEEAKAAYRSWKDGDYTAVAEHFGTGSVEALFAALGGARVKSSVTGAAKSFQRGYRRGQTRRAKLQEEVDRAEQQQGSGMAPVVPNELPAAEVARPSAPRPVVPVVPPPTAAQPPPVAPPVVPPPPVPVPAVEEAVAPPAEPKPAEVPTPQAKQPWEMTRDEYLKTPLYKVTDTRGYGQPGGGPTGNIAGVISGLTKTEAEAYAARGNQKALEKYGQKNPMRVDPSNEVGSQRGHAQIVRDAVALGKPVPQAVLAEYPDLKPPPPAETTGKDATAETYDYSSTQVNLPVDVATKVKQAAAKIPDADLAEHGREDEPHITVKYGLHTDKADAVRELLADEPPIRATLGKTSIFEETSDGDVVKAEVDSPDLHRLNKKIADALETTDTHPTYHPHVTLAYVKPGSGEKYAGMTDLEGEEITFDRITFSGKDGSHVEIELKGIAPAKAEAPVQQPETAVAFKPTGHPSTWPKQRAKADFEAKRTKAAARQAKRKPQPVDVSTPEAVHAALGVGNRIRSTDGKMTLTAGPDNSIEVKARNRQVQEFLADNQTGLGLRMEREPNGTYRYYLDANEETAGKLSRLMGEHPLAGGAVEGGTGMEAYAPTVAAPERTGTPSMAASREGQPVVEPIKRVEIIDRFRNDFGKLSIRIGGVISRGAAAEYHVIAEAIRMKKANDIPSLMHEVGHHVHKLLWGRVGQKLHSAPLQAFADELKPLDYNPNKGRIFEGFAEFVREYVMVPDSARKAAPKFYEFFENQLDTRTDLADTLLGSRSDWARWTGQDGIDRLMGSIVITPKPEQRSWLHIAQDKWDDIYARWVSSNDPFMQAANAMLQGRDIPLEEHPYFLAQSMSGSAGRAQQYLDSGTYDPITHERTGDSLKQVLDKIEKVPISDRIKSKMLARIKADKVHFSDFDDKIWAFRAYVVAARVLEKTGEQKIETGISLEDARATVEELENPEMIEAAQAFYDYQDRVFDYPVRVGVMSAEDKAKINELNKKYARFGRVIESEPGQTPGDRPGQGNPIRKMHGDTSDLYCPLEGAIYNTHAIIKWADRQRAINSLIDLADSSDASGWMVDKYRPKAKAFTFNLQEVKKEIEEAIGQEVEAEDLDVFKTLFRAGTQAPPGENVIGVLRDGKQEFYQLNEFLYRALHPKSEYDNSVVQFLLRWLGPPTRLLRLGAVGINPEFTGVTNPMRDLLTAQMQSEYGRGDPVKAVKYLREGNIGEAAKELFGATLFPRIFYTLQGLKNVGQQELHKRLPAKVSPSELIEEWRSAGGEHAAYFAMDQDHLVDSLKDVLASAPGFFAHHPVAVLRMVGEFTENMTRVGEYGLARRSGATPLEGVMKGSRPVTVDFSRAGLLGRVVNQIATFFNAKVQGTDQFARAHQRRTLPRTTFRGLMQITIPSLLLQLLNQDDPEYEELPQWQKDWYFMIPTKYFGNEALYNATPFIPIPKPFLWGLIYGTIPERIFQSIVKKDPDAFTGLLPMLLKEAIPNPYGITAAMPIIEAWAKKSFFTLQGTEPGYVSTLSKQYRAKGYTTEFSRSLSEFLYDTGMGKTIEEQTGLELTPINIDNIIFGFTGSVGMHVTRIGNIIDPDAPAATLKDIPLIRALAVRSPNSQSDSITKFYDRYEELGQRNKDAQEARKKPEGPTKGAPELTNKEQEELKRLRFFHGKISSRWKNDREIRDDKKLDRDQKRERLDQNTQEMINLAREAIGRRPYGRPTRKP